jgi:hypothetical protein
VIVDVDPGRLRLPPSRQSGADPFKLQEQIRRFGDRSTAMPPPQVTRGAGGEMMINDGVTRATRIAKLRPGDTIPVEVIDERPIWSLEHLPLVKERL